MNLPVMNSPRHSAPEPTPLVWQMREAARPSLAARAFASLARFVHLTICGLVLGVIVHLVTILIVPLMARQDAVSRFSELGTEGKAQVIDPRAATAPVVDHDPATAIAACGFDLGEGPVRVLARTGALPFGLSIHRRGGGVAYAITDRAAIRGTIEFVMLTPAQLAERIAREDDGEATRELRVVLNITQGIVLARALVRLASDRGDAQALVSDVSCGLADG
jgi:uncharacterized membrane protein